MILKILQTPNPVLREPCTEVPIAWIKESASFKQLFADLCDTRAEHHALGLAANQVGIPFRVITLSPRSDCPWQIMVNPVITERVGAEITAEEGCMSIDMGRKKFRVKRDQKIVVSFWSRKGEQLVWNASGLAARVIQHEIDHLDGTLIDRMPLVVAKRWEAPAVDALARQQAR